MVVVLAFGTPLPLLQNDVDFLWLVFLTVESAFTTHCWRTEMKAYQPIKALSIWSKIKFQRNSKDFSH